MTPAQRKILVTLKGERRQGDVSKVVQMTNLSRQYVSRCLSLTNDSYNQWVVDTLINVMIERVKSEAIKEAKRELSLQQLKSLLGE